MRNTEKKKKKKKYDSSDESIGVMKCVYRDTILWQIVCIHICSKNFRTVVSELSLTEQKSLGPFYKQPHRLLVINLKKEIN